MYSTVQYTSFFSDLNETSVLLTNFQKILEHQILWEPSCCMWTDMTKVTAAFNNLVKTPRNAVWWKCTDVSDRHAASTHGPECKYNELLEKSATYAHSKLYSD
jgi:hypothetical protein